MRFALPRQFRRPAGLVLLYHRVAALPSDPQRLAVTPAHFAEHLEVLGRDRRPVALSALADSLRRPGPVPAVSVTFDDGYADNLHAARPLLERHGVPATVFVTTGYTAQAREFWWDDLERLLLRPGRLPSALHLSVGEAQYAWPMGDGAEYTEAAARAHGGWHVEQKDDPTPRHRAYRQLCALFQRTPGAEVTTALDQLSDLAGSPRAARETHRPLTAAEVGRLAASDAIEIGAHAVSHTALSALPLEAQRREMADSRRVLADITGREPASFAYPFGSRRHYTRDTVAAVRDVGYRHACSNIPGLVRRRTDPYEYPRVLVRDWDGDAFARHLQEWQRA